jgi:DNA-binding transcriptional regulator GbsR (MarR family)
MPIEDLTREDIEKVIEEKLRKLLAEMEIWKKIAEFESSISRLRDDITKFSVKEHEIGQAMPLVK